MKELCALSSKIKPIYIAKTPPDKLERIKNLSEKTNRLTPKIKAIIRKVFK